MKRPQIPSLTVWDGLKALTLILIPAILTAVYYFTPLSFQQSLMLDHTNPQLITFWTNAFVHEHSPTHGHLKGNIIGYLLVILPCWTLHRFRNKERMFWIGVTIILAIGPLVSSLSSYVAFHEILGLQIERERGFSGVVGAFAGFLIMTILQTLAEEQEDTVAVLSMGLYFGYLIVGLGAVTGRFPFLGIGILIFVLTIVGAQTRYVAALDRLSDWGLDHPTLTSILVIASLFSAIAFAASLPANITSGSGGVTNIVAHGAGILFGMMLEPSLRYTTNRTIVEQSATV